MRIQQLCILFFSIFSLNIFAQTKKSKFNFMLGFDALHLGLAEFTDQKMFQIFASSEFKPKKHFVLETGYEKNKYNKNAYDISAEGNFIRAGILYMFNTDFNDPQNGFYFGGKLATSFYKQKIKSIPIKGASGISNSNVSFPVSSQNAYWLEGAIGGRVRVIKTNFFIDAQIQPKYLLVRTRQENIIPMVIPGFGTDSGAFKLGFMWSIAYLF